MPICDKINIYESSRRLRDLRTSRKISHEKLATDIGVSKQLLKNYEQAFLNSGIPTGTKSDKTEAIAGMSISILYKLAKYFNVSADYLLGISPNPTTDKNKNAVCEYTGLSQDSIDVICDITGDGFTYNNSDNSFDTLALFHDCPTDMMKETLDSLIKSPDFVRLLVYLAKYHRSILELNEVEQETAETRKRFETDIDWINETIDEYESVGLFELQEKAELHLFRAQESIKKIASQIIEEGDING